MQTTGEHVRLPYALQTYLQFHCCFSFVTLLSYYLFINSFKTLDCNCSLKSYLKEVKLIQLVKIMVILRQETTIFYDNACPVIISIYIVSLACYAQHTKPIVTDLSHWFFLIFNAKLTTSFCI